jgi:hypothetical protein
LQIILQELTPSEILMQRIAYECFPKPPSYWVSCHCYISHGFCLIADLWFG